MLFRQNFYSRAAAVNYAVKYALKPNPAYRYFQLNQNVGGDCANFISQCLLAGGAPMIHNSSNPWWYNNKSTSNTNDDSWSVSWAVAHSLYWFLRINEESKRPGAKGLEVDNIQLVEPGDLVFFEDDKGVKFHSAIVTSISNGVPLISHHSFEALNIPYYSSWPAAKQRFLRITV